jgi:hypothetical protein
VLSTCSSLFLPSPTTHTHTHRKKKCLSDLHTFFGFVIAIRNGACAATFVSFSSAAPPPTSLSRMAGYPLSAPVNHLRCFSTSPNPHHHSGRRPRSPAGGDGGLSAGTSTTAEHRGGGEERWTGMQLRVPTTAASAWSHRLTARSTRTPPSPPPPRRPTRQMRRLRRAWGFRRTRRSLVVLAGRPNAG